MLYWICNIYTDIYIHISFVESPLFFSAREVWEAAENHTSGVLGKPGRWAQTEQDVEQLANEIFAKHFN